MTDKHTGGQPGPVSNARLIAELQSVAIAIRIGGLSRLPEMMRPATEQSGAQ